MCVYFFFQFFCKLSLLHFKEPIYIYLLIIICQTIVGSDNVIFYSYWVVLNPSKIQSSLE